MTVMSGTPAEANEVNPFAHIAVARVMESERRDPVTVDTDAIRTATSIIDSFLAGDDGAVLAVLGDYGTGKSHLVMRLLRHVREVSADAVRCLYIEAPSTGFLDVYRRFIEQFDRTELQDRVKRYYADVVAESIGDSPLTERIVAGLRGGTTDPVTVVERFALSENTLLRNLHVRLEGVTSNSAYATALMLLMRPGFESAAWSWLNGAEPDPALTERGVQDAIGTDTAALEAMGVVALLHRTNDRRFVLVIDELDKVLSLAANPGAAVLGAFRKLLEVFRAAGAMVVLVGVPDFLEVVPPDTRERIGTKIDMPLLTADQTREFVRLSMERSFGHRAMHPFTDETIDYLVRLARGIVRHIIRLCFHAYRLATEAGTPVTMEIVGRVAREQLFLHTTEHEVREAVVAVLERNGWFYKVDHRLTDDPASKVDYWIVTDDPALGYGIVVSGSVLDDADIARLNERATAVAAARGGTSSVLLVVNGYLTTDVDAALTQVFGARPVLYEPRSFENRLTDALTRAARFLTVPHDDGAGSVHERIDQIQRQQASIHVYLEEVGTSLDRVSGRLARFAATTDEKFGDLVSMMTALTATTPPVTEARPELPQDVAQLFSGALVALADLDRFDLLLRDVFDADDATDTSALRGTIRSRLRAPDAASTAGVAVLLHKAITAFRAGVTEWYRAHVGGPPGRRERERLDVLCSTYDSIAEYLPPFHVVNLGDLVATTNEERDPMARNVRRQQQAATRDVLENLSMRVRQAVLVSVQP